jgi:radical SAM superfamily enzyme YgiQ (UPF0313 family)
MIDFGVEEGSDEALRYLRKGITVEQIKKTFKNCHTFEIRTFANMLVNTSEENEKDLQDIINLVQEIKPNIVSFNIFCIDSKYNSMFTFLPDYFSLYYLKRLIRSRRKKDYFYQLNSLAKEYIKQLQ